MVVEVNNVSLKIKNQILLENISLKMERGRIYGLVGRNGSG